MIRRLTLLLLLSSPAWAANAYIQKCMATGASGSRNCTLTGAVTAGNFIAVGIVGDAADATLSSVVDQAANSYTVIGPCVATGGKAWLAYRENVPGTSASGTTITANITGNGTSIWVREFSGIATSSAIDVSSASSCTGTSTVLNLPSITPTASGDLLYAVTFYAGTISATGSPWAAADSNIQNGEADEYLLTGTNTLTAVNWTGSPSSAWGAVIASFKAAAAGVSGPAVASLATKAARKRRDMWMAATVPPFRHRVIISGR